MKQALILLVFLLPSKVWAISEIQQELICSGEMFYIPSQVTLKEEIHVTVYNTMIKLLYHGGETKIKILKSPHEFSFVEFMEASKNFTVNGSISRATGKMTYAQFQGKFVNGQFQGKFVHEFKGTCSVFKAKF
jgi:hypothetical protein